MIVVGWVSLCMKENAYRVVLMDSMVGILTLLVNHALILALTVKPMLISVRYVPMRNSYTMENVWTVMT